MSVLAGARLLRRLAVLSTISAVLASAAIPAQAATRPAGSPTGNLDKVVTVTGGVRVTGWAWDSSTTAPVTVRVKVGSTTVQTTANTIRRDVANVYPAAGTYRGFDTTVSMPGGTYSVCATAVNVGPGADRTFACKSVTVAGSAPIGQLEEVAESGEGVRVSGWAADPDTPTTRLTVAISVDGTVVSTSTTSVARPDVQLGYPEAGPTTGFVVTVPASPGAHQVCATAIGAGAGGDSTDCRTLTVRDHSPVGTLAPATEMVPGHLRVSGTARDIDGTAAVRVTLDGVTSQVAAAATSPFGFSVDLSAAPGSHEVCVTAVNVGAGADVPLGCTSGTLVDHEPHGAITGVSDSLEGGLRVTGTAADADADGMPDLRLAVDGVLVPADTTTAARATAGATEPGTFDLKVAAAPGRHRVCVTIVNAGPGKDQALGCADVVVVDHAATGHVDRVTGGVGALTVIGWAADRDTAGPVTVTVSVDGATTDVTTTSRRDDIVAARPDLTSAAGFSVTLNAAPGNHQVCAVARSYGSGADADLGCSVVTVSAPAPSQPGASTTGVPAGQALTVHQGDLVVSTPGAVVANLDVRGYIRIKAPNVTVVNTIVRGRPGLTTSTGLITNTAGFAGLVVQDSELYPTEPSPWINGFIGSNATFTRVNIHGVVDGIHITGGNVTVDQSWIHDNLHYDNDPNQNGTPSHDDSIQIQAGATIAVRNSVLTGSHSAAIMVTQDRGPVTGLLVANNRIDNGACSINLAEKTYGAVAATITSNSFGTGQRLDHCAVIAKTTSQAVSTITSNTFTDGRTFATTRG